MASQQDKLLPAVKRSRNRLCWILVAALIGLVLTFDLLSVYARAFMGAPVVQGSVISIGMAVALLIILVILAVALYYVLKVNAAELEMQGSQDND